MQSDRTGFLYPVTDTVKCTDCGLCLKVCSFTADQASAMTCIRTGEDGMADITGRVSVWRKMEGRLRGPDVYAARHKDLSEVDKSRSGAAFAAISDLFLGNGPEASGTGGTPGTGTVYGAAFDNDFSVKHIGARTVGERDRCRGSKYVQSDMGTTFREIASEIRTNPDRKIMFTGTPCQCAALAGYLGERRMKNVLTVDMVCHGVPSPALWKKYLEYIAGKYAFRGSIAEVSFRDKSKYGWGARKESVTFGDGTKMYFSTFIDIFHKHLGLRPSCSACPYASPDRPSDITLGDFWGWEKTGTDINSDNRGVSLLLINTEKGREVLERIRPLMRLEKSSLEECMQPNLHRSTVMSPDNDRFTEDFLNRGFPYIGKKYADLGAGYNFVKLRRRLGKILEKTEGRFPGRNKETATKAVKKAGILTFHSARNYGAVLQCYALQEYMEAQGYETYVVDYRPQYITDVYRSFPWSEIRKKPLPEAMKLFAYYLFMLPRRTARNMAFEKFVKKRLHLAPVSTLYRHGSYDVILYGSDQIWNPDITGGDFDPVFFADFPAAASAYNMAFAASLGHGSLEEDAKTRLSQLLRNFDRITVREESLREFLEELPWPGTEKPVEIMKDPTLMAGPEIFRDIAEAPPATGKPGQPYVLLYQVKSTDAAMRIAEKAASLLGAGIVRIRPSVTKESGKETLSSPEQFLGYVRDAEFVVTTSFHGTVFSILFNKRFCTVRTGTDSDLRSESLLKALGMEKNMADPNVHENEIVYFCKKD